MIRIMKKNKKGQVEEFYDDIISAILLFLALFLIGILLIANNNNLKLSFEKSQNEFICQQELLEIMRTDFDGTGTTITILAKSTKDTIEENLEKRFEKYYDGEYWKVIWSLSDSTDSQKIGREYPSISGIGEEECAQISLPIISESEEPLYLTIILGR